MEKLVNEYKNVKKQYDKNNIDLGRVLGVAQIAHQTLKNNTDFEYFGDYAGKPHVNYHIFRTHDDQRSRPVIADLFCQDPNDFKYLCDAYISIMRRHSVASSEIDTLHRTIYTAIMSFACCYDIWKNRSRKTPGTFFEVVIGASMDAFFPNFHITKHVTLPAHPTVDEPINGSHNIDEAAPELALAAEADEAATVDEDEESVLTGDSVSTDLVVNDPETGAGAVLPLKITTRERVVQPFAHQRILDSAYPEKYASFLGCISEVQRNDNEQSVNQIAVPKTIALFQKHLAELNGLYYCDIPQRYAKTDFTNLLPVKNIGHLFNDVKAHLESIRAQAKSAHTN